MRHNDNPNSHSLCYLLRIEQICDRYETDLQQGRAAEIDHYVAPLTGADRAVAITELTAIFDEYIAIAARTNESSAPGKTSLIHDVIADSGFLPAIDRFQYDRRLGVGGSSSVWKARDQQLDRLVAIKVSFQSSAKLAERFAREARVVARLQHANIVRIHEVVTTGRRPGLVCEYIAGESLAERMRRQPLTVPESIDVLIAVADALSYAHQQGVVHRDIKPQNILIDDTNTPFVTDFGLASDATSKQDQLTVTGEIIGTPAFMAPEQARGEMSTADARTDVYSLGVVLYFLLTGDVPFRGNVSSVVHQVIYTDAPSPRIHTASIPCDLETLCQNCMEKQPQRRFRSMSEFRDELIRFKHGRPLLSRPLSKREVLCRWCRRHPHVATLLSAVVTLLVGVALASVGVAARLSAMHTKERAFRLSAQEARANAQCAENAAMSSQKYAVEQAAVARHEADVCRQAVHFLDRLLASADPVGQILGVGQDLTNSGARSVVMPDALLAASHRIEYELNKRPLVQAMLMDTLANACRGVGQYDEAARLLDAAERARGHAGSVAETARHHLYVGWLAQDLGQYEQSRMAYQRALSETGTDPAHDLLRAEILFQFGQLMHATVNLDRAESSFAESLRLRQSHLPDTSQLVIAARAGLQFCKISSGESVDYSELAKNFQGSDWASRTATSYIRMQFFRSLGNLQTARKQYSEVVACLTDVLGRDHPLRILAVGEYAGLLWDVGDYRTALPLTREAITRGRRLAPQHRHLRSALSKLGYEYLRGERHADAQKCFQENLDNGNNDRFDFDSRLGLLWASLSCGDLTTAHKQSAALIENRHSNVATQTAWVYYSHARVLQQLGEIEESRRYDDLAQAEADTVRKPPRHGVWQGRLAVIYSHHCDHQTAERILRCALRIVISERFPNHPRIADRRMALAYVLRETGKDSEAVELARLALKSRQMNLPATDPRIAESQRFVDEEQIAHTMLASGQSL